MGIANSNPLYLCYCSIDLVTSAMITANRRLVINKFGCYVGVADGKCWFCQPQPSKLDRVFVVTSVTTGDNNVTLSPKVPD